MVFLSSFQKRKKKILDKPSGFFFVIVARQGATERDSLFFGLGEDGDWGSFLVLLTFITLLEMFHLTPLLNIVKEISLSETEARLRESSESKVGKRLRKFRVK